MKKISIALILFLMMILVGCSEKPEEKTFLDEFPWVSRIKKVDTDGNTVKNNSSIRGIVFKSFEITNVVESGDGGYFIDYIYKYQIVQYNEIFSRDEAWVSFYNNSPNSEIDVEYPYDSSEVGQFKQQKDSVYVSKIILKIEFL